MKLKRKVISILMVIALVLSSVPLTLMPGGVTATAAPADPKLVLNRPTAGIYVNEVTRVAYANDSLKPPSGTNSVIVKATKSGVPYLSSKFATIAYAGETPYATQISFTPGVTLDSEPTISCNNTTVTYSSATPAFSNGTYTWTVSGGTAEVGSILIFTVSYTYSETNEISGKTYTNNYETQCVSYVEAIAAPTGIYSTKRTYKDMVIATDTKNRSYIATMILGENTYGSMYNNGKADGTVDFTNASAFTNSVSAWTTDFGNMKNFSGSSASKNYNVAFGADANRPLSTVYIDKSVTSTLSSLNLRFHTVLPTYAKDSNEQVTVGIDSSYAVPGIVSTFSSDDTSNNPDSDATATSELGLTLSTRKTTVTGISINSTLQSFFEGVGPCKETGTKEYTVSLKYHTPGGWTNVYVGQSFSFRFVTYDKGSLRTLVEEIQATDPTTMSVNLAEGEFKGYNPQAWYYSSGWEGFKNAFVNAKKCLAKPDEAQTDIDAAYNELKTAYDALQMRKADYSLADAYYKQAIAKNKSDYTLASWAKLQTLIDNYTSDYSALYQPAVDKTATDIKAAMDALEYTTADYTDFIANINTVNKMMTEAPTIYGKTADEVYLGWSNVISVLENSGCVYNELEGYTVGTYLDITEQSKVEGYTLLLKNAIDNLKVKGADYSEAVKAESAYKVLKLSNIVDDVAENLTKAYNELVALHNLDLSRQKDIDAAVATLKYWLDNIEYKPADTTAAINIIAEANAIDRTKYTDFTAVDSAVSTLQSKLDLDIRYQSDIDRAVAAVRSAIDNLVKNSADYTEVDKAIEEANQIADNILKTYASTYGFTAETFYSNWSDVTTAINNVVRNLDGSKQAQVDGYAAAIRKAISALAENKADYTAVVAAQDEASPIITNGSTLYTAESLNRVKDAYMAVVPNLNISQQATVDSYANNIRDAISKLEYLPASYTEVDQKITEANAKLAANETYVNAHPGYSLYTAETLSALNLAIASVDRSLNITQQSTVDGYATAIGNAISGLKYAPADYTQVELAKANIPTDLSLYTTLSVATLNSVLKKIDTTLTADQQSKADGYVTSINNAIYNLKFKDADYSKVTAAKNKVPADSSLYTEESWQHLQDKLNEVEEGLDIRYQEQVNKYAEAIETAISVLKYKPADYTDVNKALTEIPADLSIYTDETVEALNTTISGINKELDIRYQTTVDGYASEIRAKIGALKVKSADYTAVVTAVKEANAKIAEGIYTDESIANLNNAVDSVVYNLDITKQTQVDGYAAAINDAISKLEVKFVPADYTQVDSEIAKIPTDLTVYTDETVKTLNDAVNAVDRTLGKPQQPTVDGYAAAIKAAREGLKYKDADYSAVETAKGKIPADSSIYTAESWQNLQNKLKAVVEGLDITQQSRVDAFAKDIETAITDLVLLSADYSEVTKAKGEIPSDLSLYTDETVAKLNEVLNGINYKHDITQQATVDTYPPAIRAAIAGLIYKDADYSAVKTAKAKVPTDSSPYTEESWQHLQDMLNAVKEGLDITHQAEVDKFAQNIEDAIADLDYIGANYDDVRKAIEEANAAMDEKLHTAASRAAVRNAINLVNYNLDVTEQATVDGYAAAIRKAVAELEYNPADYSAVTTAKGKVPTDSSLYTAESWKNLQDKINAVEEGLDIRYQEQVSNYAKAIEQAIIDLKYLPADYTKLNEAIADAEAAIKTGYYTDETVASLNDVLKSIDKNLDIRNQKKVDMYEQAVRTGISGLKYKPADYSAVETAKGKVPANSSLYTEESWQNLQDKLNAVEEGLDIRYQEQVNNYAKAIEQALLDLKYIGADYTELREVVKKAEAEIATHYYTQESSSMLQLIIDRIDWNLDISHQDDVDRYVESVKVGMLKLEKLPADYTELDKAVTDANEKIATGWYTDESVAKLQEALDSVLLGLTKDRQDEVDEYTQTIVKATNDLVKKLANYTEFQKILDLLDNSSSEIYNNTYKNFDEVMALINAYREETVKNNMQLTIDKQSQVDEMTATLQGYIDSLELEDAKATFKVKDGSTAIIKNGYIYGLATGMSKTAFQNNFVTYENVTLTYSGNKGRYLGTGTTVTVTSTITNEVIGTYTIVIYGDINGDGSITILDSALLSSSLKKIVTLTSAQKMAANLNGDRYVNVVDNTLLNNVINKTATINQRTGKAS